MINEDRLINEFLKMVAIDSPSRDEAPFAAYLSSILSELGAEYFQDKAMERTGGNCGNIFARIRGNSPGASTILLCSHMDTVSPGRGIRPVVNDGIISSSGNTILGADDKSGVAIIIEVMRTLKEKGLPHGDIEVLFTVCEEVGLLGAKFFDVSHIKADFGYALDSRNSCSLIYAAPASNHLKFTIHGIESHAGLAPEKGLNAIKVAGHALALMPLGRIDEETTANIGLISGGSAVNIVAGTVIMEGEARSHNMEKLKKQTSAMVDSVKGAVSNLSGGDLQAHMDVEISLEYPLMKLADQCRSIASARRAALSMGFELDMRIGGGGSDANILNDKGIETAIIGTGMENVHTTEEFIKTRDLTRAALFTLNILTS